MNTAWKFCLPALLILIVASAGVLAPCSISGTQAASQRTLSWSIVATPWDGSNGMIIGNCGINDLALGPDGKTFYAVDTANNGFYKSTDAGYSWPTDLAASLTNPATNPGGARLPVWNVVVAPDDVNFVIAVADNTGAPVPSGPRKAYYSIDGGGSWKLMLDFDQLPSVIPPILPGEYISCLDISSSDAGDRDIAVGTRSSGDVFGRVLTVRYSTTSFSGQPEDQGLPATAVTSLKFSPNYFSDQTLAVVSFTAGGAALHLGKHAASPFNTTQWDGYAAYPVTITGVYTAATMIRTGIELPSDYTAGLDMSRSGCFINVFDNTLASAVFYIRPEGISNRITNPGLYIYSIAYSGTTTSGILLAGEANATDPDRALARVWQCTSPLVGSGVASWTTSDDLKSPTGGGTAVGTGHANVLLAWSGGTAYCGTSSANSILGGTGWGVGQWPRSRLTSVPSDESAFQYSLDGGSAWNQIGIINTTISQLSDVAAEENAEDSSATTGGTLYLASLNGVAPNIDSVWRSTSDPLGRLWERTFVFPFNNTVGAILRLPPTDAGVSGVVLCADLGTGNINSNIYYSDSSGDTWSKVTVTASVKDICFLDQANMYILDDDQVHKIKRNGSAWQTVKNLSTELPAPAHTLAIPAKERSDEELVFVGSEGNNETAVAWVDFSEFLPEFTVLKYLPMQGNVHVITDDRYDENGLIYAGINDSISNADGTIYRWTMEGGTNKDSLKASTDWDALEPPDRGFYGLCMLNEVLYGAWNTAALPLLNSSGADRTLEARVRVPPPPWWDQLIDGLPNPGNVEFTREPTSMHASSNSHNTLWAIDNRPYVFTANQGCLWQFVDSVAKLGPWPTSPATGSLTGADPVTGRAQQIDFKWRPLRDIFGYDVLIAKDADFTLLLSQNLGMVEIDPVTGAWVVTPADQEDPSCWLAPGILEEGRSYYWRVRGARSIMGSTIHSPWSPSMFFSVRPGFKVTAHNMGPTLLAPVDGVCSNCRPPMRFSWSPIKAAATYEIVLARDAEFKNVVVKTTTTTTAFEYKDKLEFGKPYFWQVKAVAPVISDPSPVGTFTLTENITQPQKPPAAAAKPGSSASVSDFLVWVIIVIVVILLLCINAYIFISRRRDE